MKRMSDRVLWGIVFFGIALMIVGIVYFGLRKPNEGVFYLGLGLILFWLFAMIPNRIVVKREGIVLSAFLRKKYFAFEDIDLFDWKCTGKILTTNYTGYLHMKKGGRRKILSRNEEVLKELNEIVMRALATGHSEREGETLYLR